MTTMWSSKMAAQWRSQDGDLNAVNGDCLGRSTSSQFSLCGGDVDGVGMDSQSCMDHSILAIFEDSTVSSEDKSGVEEESQTLLSALTEMLDHVEDDVGTLSPFDTLPDTKLLTYQECRDKSADEVSLAEEITARPKSPNVTLIMRSDADKQEESKADRSRSPQRFKQQTQTLFHLKNKKAENEVEVFTSTSLINLVKIMHPYCLKLHVEEGKNWQATARPSASSLDKQKKKHTLFSQEEVWKYERPSGDTDEEINVVSDDEEPLKEPKEEEGGDATSDNGKLLKSVLLNGNSSRALLSKEKKRVSFGPVQVASFDESLEKEVNDNNLTNGQAVAAQPKNTEALEFPAGPAFEAPTAPSSEIKVEDLTPKSETKARSLSLQQYRQLRQKRQPLVEKQGNYTTKWPSVSEAPKELTPILCLHGQRRNSCGSKSAHHPCDCTYQSNRCGYKAPSHRASLQPRPQPVEDKSSIPARGSGLMCPRAESKISSPAAPLPHVPADTAVNASDNKKSPVKKLVSSDPPNPVLLPLPVTQTAPPSNVSSSEPKVELNSTDTIRHLQEILNKFKTPTSQQSTSDPHQNLDYNPESFRTQETKSEFTEMSSYLCSITPALCPTTTQTKPNSECKKPQDIPLVPEVTCPPSTPNYSQPPTCFDTRVPVKEMFPEVPSPPEEPPQSLNLGWRDQRASGIEAPDLTSLLEQFEEKQAKEDVGNMSGFVSAASSPTLPAHGDLDRSVSTEKTSKPSVTPSGEHEPLRTSESGTLEAVRTVPHLLTLDIPEPLGSEIVLSTQEVQSARRKNPPPKAVQIIEPRPLLSRKSSKLPASYSSPHMYFSVCLDHDYCVSADHSLSSAIQRSRAKPSILNDIPKTTNEEQVTPNASAPATNTTMRDVNGLQRLSEDSKAPSICKALSFLESAATDQVGVDTGEDSTAPCTLPTPPPSPLRRGRDKRRYRGRSPYSDSSSCSSSSSSSSSSASRSPKRPRLHHKRSESSSRSSSSSQSVSRSPPRRYRLSGFRSRCSRSRSRSWSPSPSPSRSPSPRACHRRWRDVCSRRESRKLRREHEARIQKLKAIDERRVVYVGRIRRTMTHDELRERFSQFGEVDCVSLHFRDKGDHYGFVTFYNIDDAFAAINNGGKLRRPDELPFDICFGGRRQFCNSNYADLDANQDEDLSPAGTRFEDLDFDSLLKQAQRGLKR